MTTLTRNQIILKATKSLNSNRSTQVQYAHDRAIAYLDWHNVAPTTRDKQLALDAAEWWAMAAERASLNMC